MNQGSTARRGPERLRVTVQDVTANVAQVLDGFGQTHEVRTDVLRAKGTAPAVGETWIIDQSLGPYWTFAAFVGVLAAPPPPPPPPAAPVGPIFGHTGELVSAISGRYIVQQAMTITKIVVSSLNQLHSEATVNLMDGDSTWNITLWTGTLPTDTSVRAYTVSIPLLPGYGLFVTASSSLTPRPLNLTVQTVAVAS